MNPFLPSEIARLVLGYLKEEGCTASYKTFLQESTHLQEFVLLLRSGQEYPTSIGGRSLKMMLNEYGRLVISGQTQSSDTLVTAWSRFNLEVAQLQHLTAVLCTGGSNVSASNSFQQNAHKRSNITRRALNSREKAVLPASSICVPLASPAADNTRICTASAPMVLSGNNIPTSAAYPAVLVPSSDELHRLQAGAVDSANITQMHYASSVTATPGNVGTVPSTPQCQLVKFSPHVMLVNADSNVSRLSTVSGSTRAVCSQNAAASETCPADKQMLPSTSFSLPLDNSMLMHSTSSQSHNLNIHPEQIFSPRLAGGHQTQQIFVHVPEGSPAPDCRRTASNVNKNSCPSFMTLLNGAGDSVAGGYCSNTAADNNIPLISVATSSTGSADNTVIAGSCQQDSVERESWKHHQKENGSSQQREPTNANRTADSDMLVIREGEMSHIENSDGESDGGIVDVDDTHDLVDNASEVGETSRSQSFDQLQPSTPLKSFNDSRRKPFKSPRRKCLMPKRKVSPEPASDSMPLGSASCVAVSSRLSIASAACSSSKSSLPLLTIAEKLADNTELAQKIAENINQHRLKADGSVSVSGSGSLFESHTSGLGDELTTSSLYGDNVRCCRPTNRKKTLTSTADLSINEDSLMAALEEICTSVFSDNSLVDLSNVLSHDVRMELDAELGKIGSFPADRVAEYALDDFHSELIASASNSSCNLLVADAEVYQQQGIVRGIPCPNTVTVQSSNNALSSSQTIDCGGTIINDSTRVVSIETNVPLCRGNDMPLASRNKDIVSTLCIDPIESNLDHRLDNCSTAAAGASTADQDGEVEIATCTVVDAVPHCEQIDMVQELDYGHAPTPSSSTPLDPSRPSTDCTVPESSVCRQNLQNFVCDKSAIMSDTSQLNITDARPISDNSNIDAVPNDFVDTAVNVEPLQFSSVRENNNTVIADGIVCVTDPVQPPVSLSSNADGMLTPSETILAVGSKNKTTEGGSVKRIITSEIPSKEGAELIPVVYVNSEGVPICIEVLQPVSQFPQPLDHVFNGAVCSSANKELVEHDLTLIANQCKSRKHRLLERRLTGSDQVETPPSNNIAPLTPAAAVAAINSVAIAALSATSAPGTGANYDCVTSGTTTDAPDPSNISDKKPITSGKVTKPRSESGAKAEHSRTAHSVQGPSSENVHSSESGGPSAASEEHAENKVSVKSKSQRASSTARHSKLRLRDNQRQHIAGRSHQRNQKHVEAATADISGKKVCSPHKEINRQPGAILAVPTASPVKSANETSPGLTYSNMPDLCAARLLASLSSKAVKVLGSDNQINDPCMATPQSTEPKGNCISTFEQINMFINENYGVRGGLSQNNRRPQANHKQLETPRADGSVKKPIKTSRKVASRCANPVLSDVMSSNHSVYQKNAAEESTRDLPTEVGDHSESKRSVLETAEPSGTMDTKQRHEILAAPNSVVCGRRTVPASPSITLSSANTVQSTTEALDLSQPCGRKRQRTLSSSSSSSSDNEPLCVIARRLKTVNSDRAQSLRKPSRQNPSRKSVRLENESKRRRTTSPEHSLQHDGGPPSPNHCDSIVSDRKKNWLKPLENSEQLSSNCAVKLPVQVKRSPARKSQNETERKQNDAATSRNIFQAAGSDSFCKQNADAAALRPTVVAKSLTSLPSISCFVNKCTTASEVYHTTSLPGSGSASHSSTSASEVLSSECIVDLSFKNSCNKDHESFSTEHCPSACIRAPQSSEDPVFYDTGSMLTAEPEDHANTNVTGDNPSSAETLCASTDSAVGAAATVVTSPTCHLDQSASIGVVLHIPDASVAACDSLLADFESSTDDAERSVSLPSDQPIDDISQKPVVVGFRDNYVKTDVGLLPTAQTGASVTPAHPVNVVVETSNQGLVQLYSEPHRPKDQANQTNSQSLAEPDYEPHPSKHLASTSTKTTTTHLHLPNLNQFKIAEKLTPENISRILALARK